MVFTFLVYVFGLVLQSCVGTGSTAFSQDETVIIETERAATIRHEIKSFFTNTNINFH